MAQPTAEGVVLRALRWMRRWEQQKLAAKAGIHPTQLCAYENFRKLPGRPVLLRLAREAGVGPEALDDLLAAARRALAGREDAGAGGGAAEGAEALAAGVAEATAAAVRTLAAPLLADGDRAGSRPPTAEERARAAGLWARLEGLDGEARRWVVERSPELCTPALLDFLCEESVRAACADAGRALGLAEAAVELAASLPGSAAERDALAAHACAFLGNARRVAGDLPAAEAAFTRSAELWGGAGPFPLDATRRLDLEASFRREQRQFRRALALLDEALESAPAGDPAGRLLLNKAAWHDQQGDLEGALQTLERAVPHLHGGTDPRTAWGVHYNRAAALTRLGRFAEAAPLLPEVRRAAERLGNELDLVRVSWLEACVAGGQGRRKEALDGLERVLRAFEERRIAFDAALVCLDVAILRLERGETAEVRRLAGEMLWIFEAQGIAREALASLRLFFEAARREIATAEMAWAAAGALQGGKGGRGTG